MDLDHINDPMQYLLGIKDVKTLRRAAGCMFHTSTFCMVKFSTRILAVIKIIQSQDIIVIGSVTDNGLADNFIVEGMFYEQSSKIVTSHMI